MAIHGRVRAPQLPQAADWFNVKYPPSLTSLRGRPLLLDFWTYSCINCLHVLGDLKYLQHKHAPELVIIGVHTPKFDHERQPQHLQQAIRRHGISYPVVSDPEGYLWDQYAIRAWPSFVVIDPQGYIIATLAGEGQRDTLDNLIQSCRSGETPSSAGLLVPPADSPRSALSFPGKVLADEASDNLFIADSGQHRLVITSLDGDLKAVVGTGLPGSQDGSWHQVQFSFPQGLAFDRQKQMLWVADSGQHRVRQVDLQQQQVTTLAGTGRQNRRLTLQTGSALVTDLNSPWDLAHHNNRLCVAMAGSHQIWQIDYCQGTAATLAGSGAEFCVDGEPAVAAFAQPSGLASWGDSLYVADSETSSIRRVRLAAPPQTSTLCGSGELFGFGDQDGRGAEVRLQHCMGIAAAEDCLWIADTYNHKIKRLDPATGRCQTFTGSGPGHQDGALTQARFFEPSGLSATSNRLYVADTNNHAIRLVQLDTQTVTTLAVPNLCSSQLCHP